MLQHTAVPPVMHCNKTRCSHSVQRVAPHCIRLHHVATHCNTHTQVDIQGMCRAHRILQHTASHCNTLQHAAMHCNTLCRFSEPNHTETMLIHINCNTLQLTATYCNNTATHCAGIRGQTTQRLCSSIITATHLQHTATYCNNTATHGAGTRGHTSRRLCSSMYTATHCNTLQHTATHCNTLQHTATTLQHTVQVFGAKSH